MTDDPFSRIKQDREKQAAVWEKHIEFLKSELAQAENILQAIRGESPTPVRNYNVINDIAKFLAKQDGPVLEADIIAEIEPLAVRQGLSDPKHQIHRSLSFHCMTKFNVAEDRRLACVEMRDGKLVEVPFQKGSSRNPPPNLITLRSKLKS